MARITVTFEAEMDLAVPDELAFRMSAQDVCDSAALVGSFWTTRCSRSGSPSRCPRHSELPCEEAGIYLLPGDGFPRIEAIDDVS
jgi:hypothetical protein